MATGHIRKRIGKNGGASYQIVAVGDRDPTTGKRERRYEKVYAENKNSHYLTSLFIFIAAAYSTAAFFFGMKLASLAAEIADMLAKGLRYALMATAPNSQHIKYSFTSGAL